MPSRPPRASDAAEKSKAAPAVKLPPAVAQQKAYAQSIADLELPKTSLVKLAKGSIPDNVKMAQDVVHALMRSSTVFINYLAASAHDQALDRSGRSITAGDVIKAVAEMDFGPADVLVPILEQELAAYRAQVAAAKAAKAKGGAARRAKAKAAAGADGDADVSMAVDDDEDDDDGEEGEGEGGGEGEEGEGEGEGDEEGEAGSGAE